MLACAPECGCTLACSAPNSALARAIASAFDDVDELAAAVVALARIAFGVLVGQHRAGGFEHGAADEVLRGDQLEAVVLPAQLRRGSRRRFRDRRRRALRASCRDASAFERHDASRSSADLIEASLMPAAFERRVQPERENLVGEAERDDAAAHREDVGVVVLARQPRRVEIVAQRGADAAAPCWRRSARPGRCRRARCRDRRGPRRPRGRRRCRSADSPPTPRCRCRGRRRRGRALRASASGVL